MKMNVLSIFMTICVNGLSVSRRWKNSWWESSRKECIFLTLQGEGMLFEDLTESTKGTLTLMKNTWGYMPIKIETVGRFYPGIKTGNQYRRFCGKCT